MEMFVRPSIWFAGWTSDCFLGAVRPDTQLSLVAVRDIGAAAAAAFADPARFDGVHLELAGDVRSLREVAAVMSDVKPVAASWTGPSRTLAAAFTGRRAP